MTTKAKHLSTNVQKATSHPLLTRYAIVLGAAAALTVIVLFILANQQPPYVPEVVGRPAAEISQQFFDHGNVRNESTVTTSFKVKNVGDQTLLIFGQPQVEVVEGCCPPYTQVSSNRLAPGQEATISMSYTMHAGMDGPHEFSVHVRTNDPVNDDQIVTVLSNWIPQE
jgi:hypothetical protein